MRILTRSTEIAFFQNTPTKAVHGRPQCSSRGTLGIDQKNFSLWDGETHTNTCGRRFGDLKQMWNMKEHVFDVPKTGEWEGSARGSLVCPDGSVGWMFGHVL